MATTLMQTSASRPLGGRRTKYVTNSIDHVYYKKDWYGGDRKAATAMMRDNEEGQWKVPNPWVDIDGNPLSTVTPVIQMVFDYVCLIPVKVP